MRELRRRVIVAQILVATRIATLCDMWAKSASDRLNRLSFGARP